MTDYAVMQGTDLNLKSPVDVRIVAKRWQHVSVDPYSSAGAKEESIFDLQTYGWRWKQEMEWKECSAM